MRLPKGNLALYAGLALGVFLLMLFVFQGAFLDGFLKSRITTALGEAYPGYALRIGGLHYSILENRIECDSVQLIRLDSNFSCTVDKINVSGIGRVQLLWGGGVSPDNLVSSDMDAKKVVLNFNELKYELRCERLQVSIPDSEFVADSVGFKPLVSDERFFAGSKFRKARYRLALRQMRVFGSPSLGFFNGRVRSASTVQLNDAFLDILINKDKPFAADSLRPPMPNEVLASIAEIMELDEFKITDGRLNYGERFVVGEKPAVLNFDHIQVHAEGASRRFDHKDTVVIRAEGQIMQAGTMRVTMRIPYPSADFTLGYSGSLSGMSLRPLNPFLEISEQQRFKTGVLESLAFNVHVTAGDAKGTVTAEYKDLRIAAINGRTGSEAGVVNSIVSFISNNFSLNATNLKKGRGPMKIGQVKYIRQHDDQFFEFAWFAVRSGIGDVVGF